MSMIEAVKTYIKTTFPLIVSNGPFRVDKITKDVSYSISTVPGTILLSESVTGKKTKQYTFLFSLRGKTVELSQYIENNYFMEEFSEWLEDQNDAKIFPTLGVDKTTEKIEALTAGYLASQDSSLDTAVYQITCVITYTEGASCG